MQTRSAASSAVVEVIEGDRQKRQKRSKNNHQKTKKKKLCCFWRELKLIQAEQIFWICVQAEMQLFQPCGNNLSGQHRRRAGAGATYFSLSLSNEPTHFGNANKRGRRTCSEAPRQIWNKTYKQTTALRQSGANLNIPFSCLVFDSPAFAPLRKRNLKLSIIIIGGFSVSLLQSCSCWSHKIESQN